jgi:deazaflavin-dependent oxidoreductase (nitroreductase family)
VRRASTDDPLGQHDRKGESDGRRRVQEGLWRPSPEIELTVTGRTSGREIPNPVWFVQEGQKLYLVPVRGSDADWYKNVLKTPTIRLAAGRAQLSANASPISDAAKRRSGPRQVPAKYGAQDVEAYYPKQDVAVEVPLA